MSFLDVLGKLLRGKPIYDAPSQPSGAAQLSATGNEPASTLNQADSRTFPVLSVRRIVTRTNGHEVQVYAYVHNSWTDELQLKKIHLLGSERRLEADLGAGAEKEVVIYEGAPITSSHFDQAVLEYETHEGVYFEAAHTVHFMYHGDTKTYTIDQMVLHQPIRHIY